MFDHQDEQEVSRDSDVFRSGANELDSKRSFPGTLASVSYQTQTIDFAGDIFADDDCTYRYKQLANGWDRFALPTTVSL